MNIMSIIIADDAIAAGDGLFYTIVIILKL